MRKTRTKTKRIIRYFITIKSKISLYCPFNPGLEIWVSSSVQKERKEVFCSVCQSLSKYILHTVCVLSEHPGCVQDMWLAPSTPLPFQHQQQQQQQRQQHHLEARKVPERIRDKSIGNVLGCVL
jgi:hypothetical protein